ncbi:hypothetical protein H696_02850 [Fonticula alba]|uniref:Uncharacterized protein n=1 Tax=Fonticula alba TaxID=691883 RepID=A0A058Z9D3_FONAL|nr:hypothetical protein H696_02850 [Fonticula alba]KCV70503.1 hypothetical protein H696_02850 [Fonticula alba]|eukprot:XP_009495019.1 hypothetical protein H696_02850 [Fonticula alba]
MARVAQSQGRRRALILADRHLPLAGLEHVLLWPLVGHHRTRSSDARPRHRPTETGPTTPEARYPVKRAAPPSTTDWDMWECTGIMSSGDYSPCGSKILTSDLANGLPNETSS